MENPFIVSVLITNEIKKLTITFKYFSISNSKYVQLGKGKKNADSAHLHQRSTTPIVNIFASTPVMNENVSPPELTSSLP